MYNITCCGMIAMKFEVTVHETENSAERMSSQETDGKSLYRTDMVYKMQKQRVKVHRTHTEMCTVTACRTEIKVRKGGDFFYGKSSNENHSQGL